MSVLDYERQITRASLGRLGFTGELYDIRTESFSSRSIFRSTLPSGCIESREVQQMEFDCKLSENISDRFDLLKVEAELQVNILVGLISVGGCGKFLTEKKNSEKTVSCSMMCKMQTVCEKFFASFDEILPHIDLNALEDSENTHVIVETNWGANTLLTLESSCSFDCEKKDLEGRLQGALSKFQASLSGQVDGSLKNFDLTLSNNYNVKVCADVLPEEGLPLSLEDFRSFFVNIPNLLKKVNDGKGKPLNYVMVPLSGFRKAAHLQSNVDVFVQKVDESFLVSIICLFEEITAIMLKLIDLYTVMHKKQKYVSEENLKIVRNKLESIKTKESNLKLLITEDWIDVRSGKTTFKDLVKKVEKFRTRELNLNAYEDYLDSCTPILEKLSRIDCFTSVGVIYLGKGEKFDELQMKNPSSEFIVLVMSSETEKADPDLHKDTCNLFLTIASDTPPSDERQYVVIDYDYLNQNIFLNSEVTNSKCYHLKGRTVLNSDMLNQYIQDQTSNFIQTSVGLEYTQYKPGNRVHVEMVCPGVRNRTCPSESLPWRCYNCKSNIEYGFDEYFYCTCGKSEIRGSKFRCKNMKHGDFFITADSDFLLQQLELLKPLKELNILIIGQSGVGKSTWINSIVNYLTYDSFEQAKSSGVICTIPSSFKWYDPKTSKTHVINVGGESQNESRIIGQSVTQSSHTYNFLWEDKCVRLIDTPGLGDTRGVEQDKENLKNIIAHLGYFTELHGVCILLKATDNKLNAIFSYCIKELLVHLHKSIAKNIVFCFTNARSTLYQPGETAVVLKKLISDLGIENELPLNYETMFFLDNEAFLFLCTLNERTIEHDEILVKSFTQSWEISLTQTERLFHTIKNFRPHQLNETISLVKARHQIITLTKPLTEITKTIELNLSAIERKKEEIKYSNQTINELLKNQYYNEIHLELTELDYPVTVCTSPSCVEYIKYKSVDMTDIEYITHCHKRCYLKNVEVKTCNNAALRKCEAMESGYCKVCKCPWNVHMHITFQQRRVEKQVLNKSVEKDINEKKSAKEVSEKLVRELESTIQEYQEEKKFIIQTCVKFGMFLRQNAITVFNDSVEEYLEFLILNEENKLYKSNDEQRFLANLKENLKTYKNEVSTLEDVIKQSKSENKNITAQEIFQLEKKLYALKLTGEQIRQHVEFNKKSNEKFAQYTETPIHIKRGRKLKPTKKPFIPNFLKISYLDMSP